jgi:hypothetical protein
MNDIDFDRAIRAALDSDALRAPAIADTWPDLDRYPPALAGRPRRRWAYVAVGLVAAAAAAVLVWRAQTVTEPPVPSTWLPAGPEFVLQDLGPAMRTFSITTDGLSRQLAADGQTFVVYDTIDYTRGPTAEVSHCLFHLHPDGGSDGSCRPEWDTAGLDYGTTASLQNNAGLYDLWTWANVPADAAYVSYTVGSQVLWQKPVARVAMFPSAAAEEVAVAYTSDGREVGRIDRDTIQASTDQAKEISRPPQADVTTAQWQELKQLTATTVSTCLTEHGATITAGVAVYPPTVEQHAVWNTCTNHTKDTVAARVAQMNLNFTDPFAAPTTPSTT